MKKYRKLEVAEKLDRSPRAIQYYVDEGLIVPDIAPPSGRGRAMLFSERNLVEFSLLEILRFHGSTLSEVKSILALLRGQISSESDEEYRKLFSRSYSDFYTNPKWGKTEDVILVQAGCAPDVEPGIDPVGLFHVYIHEDGRIFSSKDGEEITAGRILLQEQQINGRFMGQDIFSINILFLGRMKNLAARSVLEE